MLKEHPIDTVLLITDKNLATEFYQQKVGLDIVEEDEHRIVVASGPGRITLSLSTTGTSDTQTQASWRVKDIAEELQVLRQRGIHPEEYNDEFIQTKNGIADVGFAWAAWIVDPFQNVLGILQMK
ncbi:MAG: hypothetical protein ACFB0B_16305 [Thermonemataceae bacterium]